MANFLQIHISATFCLQELPTVHSGEALNMGLVEGEPWSGDEDAHNKATINGGRKENDMLHKKTADTQTPVEMAAAARGPQKNSKPAHLLISGSWAEVKYPKVL